MANIEEMYQCQNAECGYSYDPSRGDKRNKIPKGILFDDLPADWRCPICGGTRKSFRPLTGPGSVIERDRSVA